MMRIEYGELVPKYCTYINQVIKVIFIYRDGHMDLRSAYDADEAAQRLYDRKAR